MGSQSLEKLLLEEVEKNGGVDTFELAREFGKDHQIIVGLVKSIQSAGELINTEQRQVQSLVLTDEGNQIAENGSHEAWVFDAIPEGGMPQSNIKSLGEHANIGFSKAMSSGWLRIDKQAEGGPRVFKKVEKIDDSVQLMLLKVLNHDYNDIPEAKIKELKKRKLVTTQVIKSFYVTKGKAFSLSVQRLEADLTADMLLSGSWRDKEFKAYNFDALGTPVTSGHLHPLMKVRAQFRQIFLEMGFTEMATNNFIESSFWNFDSLFQPQQHPARDAHDTFFISDPKFAKLGEVPQSYVEDVKRVHEQGGYGSQGYQYEWKTEEAKKNLLRTHTTAVSARMLYKLGQQEKFTPAKFFSIDRVFRNETLDATHLAEFHQIEGLVADRNLTLGDLIGTLHQFFRKLGITKLRFKPAYNPYTEPSMEVFSYHEGLKKWVEVGNSGVFRPEMLRPMGLPDDVSVIAWGLSLERPTMIKYGISNIRDLIGHKVDLDMVYRNPICLLEG
ncbi:predicted protein [Nematostella vectensis]|uniref:phenylalanine--tRNA ligase n=1 Tax=Nematostella vectensis TaxID=45351 RepID=A7SP79_NEMVE|nr:phenylalanine--tRNA ligase alpha subunit [Nematostella vectensis]EDO34480.1 predicted protein [Nematostella vectensis]|eukprot:XP_001626580.1 predicted protein [Nematostella vectensis]